jgi:hypothetical protein
MKEFTAKGRFLPQVQPTGALSTNNSLRYFDLSLSVNVLVFNYL